MLPLLEQTSFMERRVSATRAGLDSPSLSPSPSRCEIAKPYQVLACFPQPRVTFKEGCVIRLLVASSIVTMMKTELFNILSTPEPQYPGLRRK